MNEIENEIRQQQKEIKKMKKRQRKQKDKSGFKYSQADNDG